MVPAGSIKERLTIAAALLLSIMQKSVLKDDDMLAAKPGRSYSWCVGENPSCICTTIADHIWKILLAVGICSVRNRDPAFGSVPGKF